MTNKRITMTKIAAEIELETLADHSGDGHVIATSPMPYLDAIPVTVSVRVGQASLRVADLVALKAGSVLSLDAMVDRPLDVLVSGHVIARGTLVAVDDHFGVRISEVADTGIRERR